jgi:hypothetical protein
MKSLIFILFTCLSYSALTQQTFSFKILDQASNEPIPGARVSIDSLKIGAIADARGLSVVQNIPYGEHRVHISAMGFEEIYLVMSFPTRQRMATKT